MKKTEKVKTTKADKSKVKNKKTKVTKPVKVITPIKEEMNKSELFNYLAENSEIELKAVKKVMACFEDAVLGSLTPKGSGSFTIPGIVKFITRKVPARKAGVLVRNPATGEMVKGKAKPASIKVKARPLSKVKKAAVPA